MKTELEELLEGYKNVFAKVKDVNKCYEIVSKDFPELTKDKEEVVKKIKELI